MFGCRMGVAPARDRAPESRSRTKRIGDRTMVPPEEVWTAPDAGGRSIWSAYSISTGGVHSYLCGRRRASALPRLPRRRQRLAPRALVPDHLDELLRRPAAQDRLELRPIVRHQAHLLDDEIDDLPLAVGLSQAIVELDVVAATAQD